MNSSTSKEPVRTGTAASFAPLRSLQVRLTLALVGIALTFVWGLALYTAARLQAQIKAVTMDTQFAMVQYLAAELDQKLLERLDGLQGVAAAVDTARLDEPAYLEDFLKQRYVFRQQFSGGTAIIGADGRARADVPARPGRRGTYYGDRDYFTQAAATRKPYIDKPILGRAAQRPVMTMSAPLFDAAGNFRGVVIGVIDLAAPDFLGLLTERSKLRDFEFYVVAPQHHLFVTASDPRRIMAATPAPGSSAIYDALLAGFEGSMVARSSFGIEKLYSAKRVPTSGWIVELALPVDVAFRPAQDLRNTLYGAAILVTFLVMLVVGLISRRLLAPLDHAAARLDDMSSGRVPLERLPEQGDAEVRRLLASFNRLTDHLTSQQSELRRNERRLAESQRIAHVGSWEWEVQSDTNVWSAETFRIFGLDPQGTAPSFAAFIALIEPHDRERVASAKQRALEDDAPYHCEYRIHRPSGEIRVVQSQAEVVRDAAGNPLRMVGVNVDITERKRQEFEIQELNRSLEARVQRRTEDLERANRELESFSYSISHDLRAPLRAINGFSKLVLESEQDQLGADSRHMLERVAHNASRMGELIDDILDYSRSARTEMKDTDVDTKALAGAIIDELHDDYPATEFRCGALPRVRGDATMLRQVLLNLIDNAGKFSAGRSDARVDIDCTTAGGEHVFSVADNGTGFDMRYAGKLFGMFQRMHGENQFPGTGVGLAIVKRLVERHHGRVWAEAEPDRGAAFYFALPVASQASAPHPATQPAAKQPVSR